MSQLGGGGDSWYWWVGARDAVNRPTMQRTDPHHKLTPNINSDEARKCCPGEEWKAYGTERVSRNQKASATHENKSHLLELGQAGLRMSRVCREDTLSPAGLKHAKLRSC